MNVYDAPNGPEWMNWRAYGSSSDRVYLVAALEHMVDTVSAIPAKTDLDKEILKRYRGMLKAFAKPTPSQPREKVRENARGT